MISCRAVFSRASFVLATVTCLVATIVFHSAQAAPSSDLWERWLPHDPVSSITVDHYEWDRMLEVYLKQGPDGVNRFDYQSVTPHDRATRSY